MSEIKGTIKTILEVESGTSKSGKEWKKQSFVVDTGNEYNPEVCFSVFGDEKVENLSNYKVGDEVNVGYNLSSREYNGRYFHNVDAWRIEKVGSEQVAETATDETDDTLPF